MCKLYIMCGTPGSGKSTWCKENVPETAVYISRDKIRFSLVKENEPYFSKEKEVYREFLRQINVALEAGKDVYADQTSLTIAARAKLLNGLKVKPDYITVIYIKRPLDIILKYNAKRTGREFVPENAVINMYNSIQEPTRAEGIDRIVEVD